MTLKIRDHRGLRQDAKDRLYFWAMWAVFVAMAFGWQAIVLLVGVVIFALIGLSPIFGCSLAKLLATAGIPRDPLSSGSEEGSPSRPYRAYIFGTSLLYWLLVVIVGCTLIFLL